MHDNQMLTLDDANSLCRINELWFATRFIGTRFERSLHFSSLAEFSLIEVGFDPSSSIFGVLFEISVEGIKRSARRL
jgi:hypothetical protein